VNSFTSTSPDVADTTRELRRLGFDVTDASEATVSIAGSKELFQNVFGVRLKKETSEVVSGKKVDFFGVSGEPDAALLQAPGELSDLIEGVALSMPPKFFESPLAPIFDHDPGAYRPIRVPDELAVLLRAARVHRAGATGAGIKVAMPDTGFYAHSWFKEHGFRYQTAILAQGAADPSDDAYGHGTGESANIFSAAPDIKLIPIKMGDAVDAIKKARNSGANVITNSWGYPGWDGGGMTWAGLHPYLKTLATEIQLAINSGIVVCFAAGNGPGTSFPQGMPSLISVGGVHVNFPGIDFEASSYASSFTSSIWGGRNVPDVCGFVGKQVKHNNKAYAPSLLLPVQSDSTLDKIWPSTGSTTDSWGLFSGTSAACPQIAGVVALMLEKNPGLTPAKVKANLKQAARDIKTGQSASGDAATNGVDEATGAGLVDAKWSWLVSMAGVATQFFEATPEQQAELVASGRLPHLPAEFATDLIDTLRSV
ncbi:MAG: S8 family serine peptidase, partial [Microthrixaceae bacterium]